MVIVKHLHAHYATRAVAAAQDQQTALALHVKPTVTTFHITSFQIQQHVQILVLTTDIMLIQQHSNANHVTPTVKCAH